MADNILTLKVVGDIMLGNHLVCCGHGVRSTKEKKGFGFITENLGEAL